jgi:hypothetical protein
MSTSRSPFERSPLGGIGGFIVGLIILYVLFKLAGFVFSLLWYAAPVIFIASLIIDHKVFLGYVKSIKKLFDRNAVMGLVAGVLSLVLFPLAASYMLGMALFKKKLKERVVEIDEQQNGKWTEFEEIEAPMDLDIPYEELPPAPEPEPRTPKRDSGYDELFK